MKVTFVSNYINHHQMPFCKAMTAQEDIDFTFIQAEKMDQERINMGWDEKLVLAPFVRCYYESPDICKKLIMESDVVLFGGEDDESYIVDRLRAGKLTIRLSERLYKEGQWKAVSPRGLVRKYIDHTRYRKKQVYLLCYGGYVASDFHIVRAYPDKMYKWGYFPAYEPLDIDLLNILRRERRAKEATVRLMWAGRFIDWKHPEYPVRMMQRLKEKGIPARLSMAGGGELLDSVKELAESLGVTDCIDFVGYMKPEQIREKMKETDIYLFTSDFKEGWGAVLNESMNSGCAVVANFAIGAVPFLAEHNHNCKIYKNGDFEDFCARVEELAQDNEQCLTLGTNAYYTIKNEWNAEIAAGRLCQFLRGLENGDIPVWESGIMSKAPVVAPGKMYKKLIGGERL